MPPWQAGAGHLLLHVRLTPRGAADRIDGSVELSDGRMVLTARVRALPEAGAANDSLVRLLATVLGVPRRAVTIASGAQARVKQVRIECDPVAVVAVLARFAPGGGDDGRS